MKHDTDRRSNDPIRLNIYLYDSFPALDSGVYGVEVVVKLTKTWAKRTLKAVNELIGQYKTDTYTGAANECPFCMAVNRFNEGKPWGDNTQCFKCPWMVFRDLRCTDFQYQRDPIALRLRRLYGWRKRLENMIEKGGQQS